MENLPAALHQVIDRSLYISPTMVPHLKRPKNITFDALTDKEQVVLSVIEDASDDLQASQRLAISPRTIDTHRKAIMAKLKLHHKGQIMLHALQQGYVRVTPQGVYHPGSSDSSNQQGLRLNPRLQGNVSVRDFNPCSAAS